MRPPNCASAGSGSKRAATGKAKRPSRRALRETPGASFPSELTAGSHTRSLSLMETTPMQSLTRGPIISFVEPTCQSALAIHGISMSAARRSLPRLFQLMAPPSRALSNDGGLAPLLTGPRKNIRNIFFRVGGHAIICSGRISDAMYAGFGFR